MAELGQHRQTLVEIVANSVEFARHSLKYCHGWLTSRAAIRAVRPEVGVGAVCGHRGLPCKTVCLLSARRPRGAGRMRRDRRHTPSHCARRTPLASGQSAAHVCFRSQSWRLALRPVVLQLQPLTNTMEVCTSRVARLHMAPIAHNRRWFSRHLGGGREAPRSHCARGEDASHPKSSSTDSRPTGLRSHR